MSETTPGTTARSPDFGRNGGEVPRMPGVTAAGCPRRRRPCRNEGGVHVATRMGSQKNPSHRGLFCRLKCLLWKKIIRLISNKRGVFTDTLAQFGVLSEASGGCLPSHSGAAPEVWRRVPRCLGAKLRTPGVGCPLESGGAPEVWRGAPNLRATRKNPSHKGVLRRRFWFTSKSENPSHIL